ncbi:OAM dimerization domain-containing protein [Streptomyces sp. NPDC001941]|uniref:lysine 5,6-aminomutase subunit beta n=1 Tax=Streptomyces sp. NPDC001941 TaxID=3154659 RepID=UPI00331C42F8
MSSTEPTTGTVRPYGDTTGDGMVQLSFTLPLPLGPRAEGAALQLARRMGMDRPLLVHSKAVGGTDFSFFVVYGAVTHAVELSEVEVAERDYPLLSAKECDAAIDVRLGRPLVVLGACIGTDAHTVGIDAILNIKGFAGEKGLEYYKKMRVLNLGAQVAVGDLVRRARAERADAVLVSQAVTQRDAHLTNVRELSAELRAEFAEDERPLLVVGGPRFDASTAASLGADRIFGRGTTPGDVASYLVHALASEAAAVPAAVLEGVA